MKILRSLIKDTIKYCSPKEVSRRLESFCEKLDRFNNPKKYIQEERRYPKVHDNKYSIINKK